MEELEEKEVPVFKGGIRTGFILGIIGVVISLVSYIIDPNLLGGWTVGVLSGVLGLVIFFVLAIKFRKGNTGYMTFGQAFLFSFVAFAFSFLISTAFEGVLFIAIDSELSSIVAESAVENSKSIFESLGMPEDAMEEQLDQVRADTLDRYTPVGLVKSFFLGLIFVAIFSLITGLIIKKREPIIDDF